MTSALDYKVRMSPPDSSFPVMHKVDNVAILYNFPGIPWFSASRKGEGGGLPKYVFRGVCLNI